MQRKAAQGGEGVLAVTLLSQLFYLTVLHKRLCTLGLCQESFEEPFNSQEPQSIFLSHLEMEYGRHTRVIRTQ